MIAKNNEVLTSASETLYQFNSDEMIREQCLARLDYERHERYVKNKLAEQEQALKECRDTISEQADTISEQADTISEQADTISEQADTISELEAEIKALQEQLAEKNK